MITIEPARQYRERELTKFGLTPFRSPKSTRKWMLTVGARHVTKRVVAISGQHLAAALGVTIN